LKDRASLGWIALAALGVVAGAYPFLRSSSPPSTETPPPTPTVRTLESRPSDVTPPSEKSVVTEEAEGDPCQAQSALEASLLIRAAMSGETEIARRSFYAASDGRTLLVRQRRLSPTSTLVEVSAGWVEQSTGLETTLDEMHRNDGFMESQATLALLGPVWTERLKESSPTLVESERSYDHGTAFFQNESLVELRHQHPSDASWIRCPRARACECSTD